MKRVLRPGSSLVGKPPTDAVCKVHYTGWLMDGTRFDSSRDRFGNPFFKLGSGMERECLEKGAHSHAGATLTLTLNKSRNPDPDPNPHHHLTATASTASHPPLLLRCCSRACLAT